MSACNVVAADATSEISEITGIAANAVAIGQRCFLQQAKVSTNQFVVTNQ